VVVVLVWRLLRSGCSRNAQSSVLPVPMHPAFVLEVPLIHPDHAP